MLARPAAPGFAAVALLACWLVTGCSGGGSAEAAQEQAPPPSAEEQAYYGCLEKNGIGLEKRDDGLLRVDKDQNNDASLVAAETKCADLRPGLAAASPAPAAVVARAKKFSACIRENGFAKYPDPDPTSGQVELAGDEAAAYKTAEFLAAATKCSTDSGGDVVGG